MGCIKICVHPKGHSTTIPTHVKTVMAGIGQSGTAEIEKTRIWQIPQQTTTNGRMVKYSHAMQHLTNTSIWLSEGASTDQNMHIEQVKSLATWSQNLDNLVIPPG